MALFKHRQEYLETRILFHDAAFCELSTSRSRRKREKKEAESQFNLIKHSKNGASLPALAEAQSLQMKLLNSRFRTIEEGKTYRLNKHQLQMEIENLTKVVLSELFTLQKLM